MRSRPHHIVRGDILAALRRARGLTLRELSDLSGVDHATLHLMERGERPGRPHVDTLAHHLGVTPAVLTGRDSALRVLREAKGMSQASLARAVGVSHYRIADIEAPDRVLAQRIADQLGVPVCAVVPAFTDGAEAAA